MPACGGAFLDVRNGFWSFVVFSARNLFTSSLDWSKDTRSDVEVRSIILQFFIFALRQYYLGHMAWRPPSMGRLTPVMKLAASDARKAMLWATSSTSPGRPRAWVCLHLARNWKVEKTNRKQNKQKKKILFSYEAASHHTAGTMCYLWILLFI